MVFLTREIENRCKNTSLHEVNDDAIYSILVRITTSLIINTRHAT